MDEDSLECKGTNNGGTFKERKLVLIDRKAQLKYLLDQSSAVHNE